MPLLKSASNKARSTNIREMIAAGHPAAQAEAAAYRNQRQARSKHSDPPKRKDTKAMAREKNSGGESPSHAPGHEVSGDGVRMQHANAMGKGPSGDFGVKAFHEANHAGGEHPDADMKHVTMKDEHRAGPPMMRVGAGKMHATAHSDHGPHHVKHGMHGQHHGHAGAHRGMEEVES